MEQKKHIVIFKVSEINGYELIVERKEMMRKIDNVAFELSANAEEE